MFWGRATILLVPRRERTYYVYILSSLSGTLYIGVTNSIFHRVLQHRGKETPSFTSKYDVDRLLYYETFSNVLNAIAREKQLKGWTRKRKIALIESMNPKWEDLAKDWGEPIGKLPWAFATQMLNDNLCDFLYAGLYILHSTTPSTPCHSLRPLFGRRSPTVV